MRIYFSFLTRKNTKLYVMGYVMCACVCVCVCVCMCVCVSGARRSSCQLVVEKPSGPCSPCPAPAALNAPSQGTSCGQLGSGTVGEHRHTTEVLSSLPLSSKHSHAHTHVHTYSRTLTHRLTAKRKRESRNSLEGCMHRCANTQIQTHTEMNKYTATHIYIHTPHTYTKYAFICTTHLGYIK